MSRHAILVMAHGNLAVTRSLIRILDDSRFHMFMHLDAKAPAMARRDAAALVGGHLAMGVTMLPSRRVAWGSGNFLDVTLDLLAAAHGAGYDYYHLVSGADLPLRRADDFVTFMDVHHPTEWVGVRSDNPHDPEDRRDRVRFYYPLQRYRGRAEAPIERVAGKAQGLATRAQRLLGVDRLASSPWPYAGHGCTWWSITHEFAGYLIEHRGTIHRIARDSWCADEVVVQMALRASPWWERRARGRRERRDTEQALRQIDWSRGNPYVYRRGDIPDLLASDCLFARKFDPTVDLAAIEGLERSLPGR